ncbi:MAG: hypothetical protein J6U52_03265 [Alistipes sp.]|nr:hypothetical protein [Alistipes sp.]
MKFTKIPEAHSSFRDMLVYGFDTEAAAHDVELKIINADTGETIATKRLYGISQGEVDIAPYLRRGVKSQLPPKVDGCGVVECGMQCRVKVEADGVMSPVRRFIAARVNLSEPYTPLMTQIAQRTMACDEFDIISWFAHPEIVVEVVVESYGKGNESLTIRPSGVGQQAVAISALDFSNSPEDLRATVMVDGVATTVVEYEIKPNLRGARRVAWLNEELAPELYTFPLRKSVLVKAVRKHIESIWGREAASLESENELKLISAYEPQAQIKALSGILAAERLWLVEGGVPQRIDLVTDRVLAAPGGEMSVIEVDIRAAKEGVRLW